MFGDYFVGDVAEAKAGRYLSAGVSPFEAKFRKVLDGIDRLERNVEKDIAVLRSEGKCLSLDI